MKYIPAQTLATTHTVDGIQVTLTKSYPPMYVTADGQHYTFDLKPLGLIMVVAAGVAILTSCAASVVLFHRAHWLSALGTFAAGTLTWAGLAYSAFEWQPGPAAGLYRQASVSSDGMTLTIDDGTFY
jgi:hypothetical protein